MYKTDSVDVGNIFGLKAVDATALVGDGDDRAPVWPEQVPEIFFDPGQRAMTLRDLMNVGQTQSNAVEYFQETDFDPDSAASRTVRRTKRQNCHEVRRRPPVKPSL